MKPKSENILECIKMISFTTLTILMLVLAVSGTNGSQKNDGASFPFLRTDLLDRSDNRGYDPETSMKRRSEILSQICLQFSDPINPEFLGLYGNYFDSDKMDLESRRTFSLGHSFTSCVPDFPGNEIVKDFFNRIGIESDETDSMDPCSAFQFLKSAEPDRSNEPIEHPDYPGVYYIPGRKKRSECHIKQKLKELRFKAVAVQHPMERVAGIFRNLSRNKTGFAELVRKEPSGYFWTPAVSFAEFVDYLVSEKSDQSTTTLLEPYWKACKVCQPPLRPNLVVKAEHLDQDLDYVAGNLGVGHHAADGLRSGTKVEPSGELFSALNIDQVSRLYELLRLDHELFGFDATPYFKLVTP